MSDAHHRLMPPILGWRHNKEVQHQSIPPPPWSHPIRPTRPATGYWCTLHTCLINDSSAALTNLPPSAHSCMGPACDGGLSIDAWKEACITAESWVFFGPSLHVRPSDSWRAIHRLDLIWLHLIWHHKSSQLDSADPFSIQAMVTPLWSVNLVLTWWNTR